MLIILSSLTFSQENTLLDYLLSAIYFLCLVIYLINQCSYPLPFFRNKSSQFLIFFSRILGPLFVVFPKNVHFVFFIYMVVIVLL